MTKVKSSAYTFIQESKFLWVALEDSFGESKLLGEMNTPIGSLNLKIGDMLGYWFDSGDDWWHQINVIDIRDEALLLEYPKITKNEVANPPQYTD